MSADSTPNDVSQNDLPRRTCRQWWRQLPAFWRITITMLLFLCGSSVTFAVRFYFGLQESAEITDFRERAYSVRYFWEPDGDETEPFAGHGFLMSGLWGRAGRNIDAVSLIENSTDDDLAFLGKNCRNLRWLHARYTTATSKGIDALRPCRRLQAIDLTDAELSDDGMEIFLSFPELVDLHLCGTRITDAAIPVLKRIPQLYFVDLSFTDVSSEAAAECQAVNNPEDLDHEMRPAVIWSDRSLRTEFEGETTLTFEPCGDKDSNFSRKMSTFGANRRFIGTQMTGWMSELKTSLPDGEYEFQLALGKHASAPARIAIQSGYPLTHNVVFHMPTTYAEAQNPVAAFAIRWADGKSDWPLSEHWGDVQITSIADPSEALNLAISMHTAMHFRFEWDKLIGYRDGDYHFTLHLDRHHSEPVSVTLRDGRPTTKLIEFRMPMTKSKVIKKPESEFSRLRQSLRSLF